MKRAALITFTLFLLAIVYSSCQEDIYMDWKLQNDRFYATLDDSIKNDTLGIFHKTSSGLYYKVLNQGNQRHPDNNSVVIVKYTGSLVDGSVFESKTAELYLSETIKGWQEALHKMQTNANYILYIPSKLGYDTISPYSVLRFDIELLHSY
jgi:FKBP-type peptidyl-prolyl cis-trans isomerase FkpA